MLLNPFFSFFGVSVRVVSDHGVQNDLSFVCRPEGKVIIMYVLHKTAEELWASRNKKGVAAGDGLVIIFFFFLKINENFIKVNVHI